MITNGEQQAEVMHEMGPIDSCPDCNGRDFLTEDVRDTMVFTCLGCGARWRYELGFVWQVL